jgi:hypothetical protein
MLYTVPNDRLHTLAEDELSDALERGEIVYFPECPVALPEPEDLAFLRDGLGGHLSRKNVSYYPDANRLVGLKAEGQVLERAHQALATYSRRAHAFLSSAMPRFFNGVRTGTTSFRPLEERGRNLKPHASNELVHVDAGAYGATHGDRILRFFTNVHPAKDRVWISKGTFPELYRRFGQAAGIIPRGPSPLEEGPLDRLYSGLIRSATRALPMLRVIDSSPYDRQMRRFHNYMKDSPAFRGDAQGHHEFSFRPFSSWMVLTDMVSHACTSGQFAFADTFLIPLENCHLREHSPYQVLTGPPELARPVPIAASR